MPADGVDVGMPQTYFGMETERHCPNNCLITLVRLPGTDEYGCSSCGEKFTKDEL